MDIDLELSSPRERIKNMYGNEPLDLFAKMYLLLFCFKSEIKKYDKCEIEDIVNELKKQKSLVSKETFVFMAVPEELIRKLERWLSHNNPETFEYLYPLQRATKLSRESNSLLMQRERARKQRLRQTRRYEKKNSRVLKSLKEKIKKGEYKVEYKGEHFLGLVHTKPLSVPSHWTQNPLDEHDSFLKYLSMEPAESINPGDSVRNSVYDKDTSEDFSEFDLLKAAQSSQTLLGVENEELENEEISKQEENLKTQKKIIDTNKVSPNISAIDAIEPLSEILGTTSDVNEPSSNIPDTNAIEPLSEILGTVSDVTEPSSKILETASNISEPNLDVIDAISNSSKSNSEMMDTMGDAREPNSEILDRIANLSETHSEILESMSNECASRPDTPEHMSSQNSNSRPVTPEMDELTNASTTPDQVVSISDQVIEVSTYNLPESSDMSLEISDESPSTMKHFEESPKLNKKLTDLVCESNILMDSDDENDEHSSRNIPMEIDMSVTEPDRQIIQSSSSKRPSSGTNFEENTDDSMGENINTKNIGFRDQTEENKILYSNILNQINEDEPFTEPMLDIAHATTPSNEHKVTRGNVSTSENIEVPVNLRNQVVALNPSMMANIPPLPSELTSSLPAVELPVSMSCAGTSKELLPFLKIKFVRTEDLLRTYAMYSQKLVSEYEKQKVEGEVNDSLELWLSKQIPVISQPAHMHYDENT